jgi:murein DD-endopeptidase MepM/ murein hydrolase activator NlpD
MSTMARRHWTLLLVSDDQTQVRQFRLSRELVKGAIAVVLIAASVLVSLAGGFFVKEDQRVKAGKLERENELLLAEVHTIRDKLSTLHGSLEQLTKRDEQVRLVAGLDPIDGEVRLAGIGGPGSATLSSDALWRENPEVGELAFTVSSDLDAMLRRARILSSSWREATDSLESKHDRLQSTPSIRPTYGFISSGFTRHRFHPVLHYSRPHEGIDIAAPRGTPILASAKGRVRFVGRRGDYGLMVEIDHGYGVVTRYAHASSTTVRTGQQVERGEKIGTVGSTGLATGPHLHYEVLQHGRPVDPRRFILDWDVIPE